MADIRKIAGVVIERRGPAETMEAFIARTHPREQKNCGKCFYYRPDPQVRNERGDCIRYPPSVEYDVASGKRAFGEFPLVLHTTVCGEFTHKE